LVATTTRTLTWRARVAHRHDFAVAERPQQDGLPWRRQLPDFVEKQHAAVGRREHAALVRHRPRETSLAVPEQLADAQCEELLARPRFARDQHRGVRLREPRRPLQRRLEGRMPPQQQRPPLDPPLLHRPRVYLPRHLAQSLVQLPEIP
jgi:hypothetical protein